MMEAQIDRVEAVSGATTSWKTIKLSDTVGLAAINQVVITPGRDAYCNGYLRSLSDRFLIEGVK